jgi:hypothetical protein
VRPDRDPRERQLGILLDERLELAEIIGGEAVLHAIAGHALDRDVRVGHADLAGFDVDLEKRAAGRREGENAQE